MTEPGSTTAHSSRPRRASESIARSLRLRLYDHLQHLPASYHDKAPTGDQVQRCTSDVDQVRLLFASQGVEIARAVLLLVDARHPGLESDLDAWAWVQSQPCPSGVIGTKVDKLTRAERTRNARQFQSLFEIPVPLTSGSPIQVEGNTPGVVARFIDDLTRILELGVRTGEFRELFEGLVKAANARKR